MTSALLQLADLIGPRNPLGPVVSAGRRLPWQESEAAFEGATNLLIKARRALAAGDDDRADAVLRRAAAMPRDRWQEWAPAAYAAGMMIFNMVVDELEESGRADRTWLEAALETLGEAAGSGRADLQYVLRDIDHDYRLERRESTTIRRAIADLSDDHMPLAEVPADPELVFSRTRPTLQICNAYARALAVGRSRARRG